VASKNVDGISIIRDAFPRTIRLVATARLRAAVLKALADTDQELAELAEIEGATSNRLIAQDHGIDALRAEELIYNVPHSAFINASFVYAKPGQPNRFNDSGRGAWYAALEVETSLAEVAFHMADFLSQTDTYLAVVEYAELFASLAGEYVDLRANPAHPSLDPDVATGYPAGNALAATAIAEGINGIVYPSVRHKDGTCFAVLWPHAVQSVAQGDVYRMTWSGNPTPAIERDRQ
jgi:RES domain-containing protein